MLKKYTSEKGQSMVEFALVLPILLILVCGTIDFGWLFYNQLALNNTARETARYAVVNTMEDDSDALIKAKAIEVAPAVIKPINTIITYSLSEDHILEGDVTIVITANVKILTPLLGVFSENQQRPISSKVIMKVES